MFRQSLLQGAQSRDPENASFAIPRQGILPKLLPSILAIPAILAIFLGWLFSAASVPPCFKGFDFFWSAVDTNGPASKNMQRRSLENMSKSILSVSYDSALLATREMLLEQKGYEVTSALGFTDAAEHCKNGSFDLFILGHSILKKDKLHLIEMFRRNCPAPILSLERFGETKVPCDFHASPDDPEKFLQVVDDILAKQKNRPPAVPN